MFGKSPLIRPAFGYKKIDIDLRQTPKEFIKHPNNDYVFLTFKTDEHFFNNERELTLLMHLFELEQSNDFEKIQLIEDVRKQELEVFYDI